MTSSASRHCGSITAECLATCPASVISLMALNRLLDSDDAPKTVGDGWTAATPSDCCPHRAQVLVGGQISEYRKAA